MKKVKKITLIILAVALLVLTLIIIKNEIYATTTLPKVYLTVNDVEAFENMQKGDKDQLATLVYEDNSGVNFTSNIKIKVQGSSSAKFPKKNYTINLYNDSTYAEKQKVDMGQGWGKFNKYCLKANWIDDLTHSRNIVTARLAAKMQAKYGLFEDTPNNGLIDGFPVEIYLNGEMHEIIETSGDIYVWVCEVDSNRTPKIVVNAKKIDRIKQMPLGTRLTAYFFNDETTTFCWEVNQNENRKVNIKIGTITDKSILKAIKNGEADCLQKLLNSIHLLS